MPDPRRRIADAWVEFRDATIPDHAHEEQRRHARHAFYCGAVAYFRGLATATNEAGEIHPGDVGQMGAYIIESAKLMQAELLTYSSNLKKQKQKRLNGSV